MNGVDLQRLIEIIVEEVASAGAPAAGVLSFSIGSGTSPASLTRATASGGLLGLSLGSVQPMVMSTLHQITPESRHGEALGLRLMSINISSVLMPMVFGATGSLIGIAGVFWCVSAVVTSGAQLAWRLRADKNHG